MIGVAEMEQQRRVRRIGVETAFFSTVLLLLLIASTLAVEFTILIAISLSIFFFIFRPTALVYLIVSTTLFLPELPVGPGLNPNLLFIGGLGVAVLGRMTGSETKTLPESRYVSIVCLYGIVGILSLLKALAYFEPQTVLLGGAYLFQWLLYLSIPFLIVFHVQANSRQITDLLAFILLASTVMALYLLGLFLLDIRPVEMSFSIAGHRPLVAFWQQGQLAVGMFTALTTLVSLGLAIKESDRRIAITLVALSGLCGFLTLATLARSAILGLVVGLLIIGYLEYRRKMILAVLIAAPLVILLAPEWLVLRFTRSTFFWREVPELGISIPIGTLWKRVNGWVKLGGMFVNNPLVGIGFSLSQERAAQLLGSSISPDNQYVGLLVEIGMIGFVVFWLWVRQVFRRLYDVYRKGGQCISGLALGVLGAFAGFLVWGFFQGFYARWRVLGPLFIYIGLVFAGHESTTTEE